MQDKFSKPLFSLISGEEIRAQRLAKGLKLREVARMAGVNAATLSAFETGRRQRIHAEMLERIQAVLGMEVPLVGTLSKLPAGAQHKVPVVSMAQAQGFDPVLGSFTQLLAEAQEQAFCALDRTDVFALRVEGEALPPGVFPGDILAATQEFPANGDTVAVCIRGVGVVFRRWTLTEERLELQAFTPEARTFAWSREEVFQQGVLLWRWKLLGTIWHPL